jgi:hypothetical protein
MGADQYIHLAGRRRSENFFQFRFGAKATEHLYRDWVTSHPLPKRVQVLLGEHGGRHKDRDLSAALH